MIVNLRCGHAALQDRIVCLSCLPWFVTQNLHVLSHWRIHHLVAFYSAWLKITVMILSCPLTWTWSVLWQHIVTSCACVQFTVYEGTSYTVNYTHARTHRVTICCHNTNHVHVNGHDRIITVIFSQALYKAPWWWILCGSNSKYSDDAVRTVFSAVVQMPWYSYAHHQMFVVALLCCGAAEGSNFFHRIYVNYTSIKIMDLKCKVKGKVHPCTGTETLYRP